VTRRAGEIPPTVGTGLKLATGEILLVPADLSAAVDQAWGAAVDRGETAGEWRAAFGDALVEALHQKGLILVSRTKAKSREAVNVDIYSLALAGKYAAETRLEALQQTRARQARLVGQVATVAGLFLAFIVAPGLLYSALCCGPDDRALLAAAILVVGTAAVISLFLTRTAFAWLERFATPRQRSIGKDAP
jgi:hypothetical protein